MNLLLHWLGLESGASAERITHSVWVATHAVPPWMLIALAVVGLALALVNFLPQIGMRRSVRVGTFLLRVGMVAIVAVVLLGLEWHVQLDLAQPQEWLALVDDSASMATTDAGSESRFAAAKRDVAALQAGTPGVHLRVATFSGAPLGDAPGQGSTDFASVLTRQALSRQALDHVVLLTDGRDSDQRDLAPLGAQLQARHVAVTARVYGSATRPHDSGIFAEPDRQVIRLGEPLVVQGNIVTDTAAVFTVVLKEDGKQVATREVQAEELHGFAVRYTPIKAGRHLYTLELPATDALSANNRASFNVEVVQEKIKVLLIEGYPRFEFKLFKSVLEVDPLVDLVSVVHLPGGGVYVQGNPLHRNPEQGLIDSQADLYKYDVVILKDLPRQLFRAGGDTSESRLSHLVEFVNKRGGGLVVTGGADVYRAGGYETSQLVPILPFDLSDAVSTESQFKGLFFVELPPTAFQHPLLRLLPKPADNKERLTSLRQLDGSNNVGRLKPMATPLMNRTVTVTHPDGSSEQKVSPIMAYMAVGEGKVLATATDTMWRWQLQPDFDDPPLTMLLANAVRYLAPPPSRPPGQPNVNADDALPQVGRDLVLTTELRDKNYDPIREADLVVTVTRPDKSTLRLFPRDLPEEPGRYVYHVPIPEPGPYKVDATYAKATTTREFLAGAAAGELTDLAADPAGMATLAGGKEHVITDLPAWLKTASQAPASRNVVRELEVWNCVPLLVLFILFVCLDTYIRKRQGLA